MTWNHRVMKFKGRFTDEEFFEIHEVYYNEDGSPAGYTEEAVGVYGSSPAELAETLNRMQASLLKPILTRNDF